MSSDHLRQPRGPTSPRSIAPAISQNGHHGTIRSSYLGPDVVLRLQREAGNQAVSSQLAVQRGVGAPAQAASVTKKSGPTWEDSLEIFKALNSIFQVSPHNAYVVDVRDGLAYKTGFPAAYAGAVPSKHMHILHLWYAAARGGTFAEIGPPHLIRGPDLLEHILRAKAATQPFVTALRSEGDDRTEPYLRESYFDRVDKLVDRAHTETAEAVVEAAADRINDLASPQQVQQEKQVKRAIADAIALMSSVTGQVNQFTGDGLEDAFRKILAQNPPPGPVGQNLAGLKLGVAVGHVNDVLGALKAITDLTDPEQQKKLFDEKMGPWGYVQSGASLFENVATILQGTVAGATGLTAALASVLGHADEAAKLLAHSSKITGGLGKVIAVLSIAKGVAILVNDKSSTSDKLGAVADVTAGVGALVGGAVGGGLAGAALAFKINLSILELGVGMSRALISIDLRKAFNTIKQQGNYLATWGNRVTAASLLLEQETEPTKKQYLAKEYDKYVRLLRGELQSLVKYNTTEQKTPALPGYWEEVRRRFKGKNLPQESPSPLIEAKIWARIRERSVGIGPAPEEDTPVEAMMEQARRALEIMSRILEDYEKILDEETYNAWRDHG